MIIKKCDNCMKLLDGKHSITVIIKEHVHVPGYENQLNHDRKVVGHLCYRECLKEWL